MRGRSRRAAGALAALLVSALAMRVVVGGHGQLGQAAQLVSHPLLGWVSVAVVCELLSYVAYAAGQRRLLNAVGRPLSLRWLASLSVAAQCLSNFLPAGYVLANLLNFRELRRRELKTSETAWVLLMSSLLYVGALGVLAIAGSQIAGSRGGSAVADLRLAACAALALALLCGVAALLLARRGQLERLLGQRGGRLGARLSRMKLTRRDVTASSGFFLGGWAADAACLAATFYAVGGTPPWGVFLMGYCAAQLVSFLPITPGGLGLVEGSLALTLAAGGVAGRHVLAAVLLYRLISYWGTLPAGALGYLAVRRNGARLAEPLPEAAPLELAGAAPAP